jgi:hypothetical protein
LNICLKILVDFDIITLLFILLLLGLLNLDSLLGKID